MTRAAKATFAAVLGAGLVLAFLAGRLTSAGRAPEPPDHAAAVLARVAQAEARLGRRLDRMEAKLVERSAEGGRRDHSALAAARVPAPSASQSVAASAGSASPASASDNTDDEREDVTPESVAAYDRARKTIDDAVARSAWTEADRDSFNVELSLVTDSRRQELIEQLVLRMNEQRFKSMARPAF